MGGGLARRWPIQKAYCARLGLPFACYRPSPWLALLTMRSRGLLRALLVAGAAIATSSFVGVPAGAGLSRHARASSRATRMMAYKVPEATQGEWVASHVESKAASQLGPSGGLAKAG